MSGAAAQTVAHKPKTMPVMKPQGGRDREARRGTARWREAGKKVMQASGNGPPGSVRPDDAGQGGSPLLCCTRPAVY
ncbi:hypothetical protein CATMQ487_21710 [Sphaerotilus microaerophilus]|uniref:Uncharacterized protein n=1 Tax=Sphaerotilus microaerophilus TaxID=2914710 RepID=A0ABM7YL90_9BURK|nr:hypothetical protein CATMQ487_21710 [Sphaerotilus sp. FB-5]